MKAAFGAEELQKVQAPDGTIVHAKMRFGGDAVIELSEARGVSNPLPGLLHMYVPNADEVYARAIAAGAKTFAPAISLMVNAIRRWSIRSEIIGRWRRISRMWCFRFGLVAPALLGDGEIVGAGE